MRASRHLSILMSLQARGRVTARALANEAEVSVRTIYRDVEHLSAAGVPVLADRGRDGGFRLLDGWRTKLTGLTPHEAQSIFMSGLPGPATELGLGEAMASAQLKLLAALPADWQEDARRVSSRFHLDPVGWYQGFASTNYLPAVANAVWNERRLGIRYESWKGEVEREIDPLGIVLKAGDWYVAGRTAGKVRTFRLGSIRELTLTEERFARPRDFDLAKYWAESTKRFEAELYRGTAVVRASPRGLQWMRRLSAALARAVDECRTKPGKRGWTRLAIPIETLEHATLEMLKLGTEVEVLEPPELRKRMAGVAAHLAKTYARL